MTNKKDFAKGKQVFSPTTGKIYNSCVEAASELHIHPSAIGKVCNGYCPDIDGHKFVWANAVPTTEVPQAPKNKGKPIYCITTGQVFANGKERSKALGIPANAISEVCTNTKANKKTAHKMRFCFVTDMPKYASEISERNSKALAMYGEIEKAEKAKAEQERKQKQYEKLMRKKAKLEREIAKLNMESEV